MEKRIAAVMLAGVMGLTFAGCGSDSDDDGYTVYEQETADVVATLPVSHETDRNVSRLTMEIKDGNSPMTVYRPMKKSKPMGKKDTWTIFLYLCGTDLERRFYSASDDLLELCAADSSENVRFVIQTGASEEWLYDEISPDKCQRWIIENGNIKLVDSKSRANMGEPDTLADFLSWGVKNYPAEKMGVTLWDHGSGCIRGACFDELSDDDSITLAEMDDAFASVYKEMTDQFEFIGFDCCLMSTAETANIMASYARYFYGSEETEPICGWDYIELADFLAENPSADGRALGKAGAESYYEHCAESKQEKDATFTILSLENYDDLVIAFNDYAKELYKVSDNDLSGIVRGIKKADNFGGNNILEGYTNMVDMGDIVNRCSSYCDGSKVISALKRVVYYNINGKYHRNATGLSIYYPLKKRTDDLNVYSAVTLSPYYLSLLDKVASGYSSGGSNSIFSSDGSWHSTLHGESGEELEYSDESGISSLIFFEQEPFVEDNFYSFVLDERSLEYTAGVEAYISKFVDKTHMLELGEICDVYEDWETGEFADCFDGYWFSLPDGQLLPTYIVSADDDIKIFTSSVLLNGERTNLRISCEDVHNHIEGVWSGIDENGMAGRDLVQLRPGDVICPVYTLTCLGEDEDDEVNGKNYTWETGDDVTYNFLEPGRYLYGFGIRDVYGDYYITDYVPFTMDDEGEVTFVKK